MCGITGCISRSPVLDPSRLVAMRDSLAHRGPDDAGTWCSEGNCVMLASRRLAILDLSPQGHQPMTDASGNLTISFNGEIYNYLELRKELVGKGFRFRSESDTEVILAAYDAWGAECLRRFNGMFAFAIWDRQRQQIFLARDRFGEKPLYYYLDPLRSVLLFGSEIKALLAAKLFEPAPNLRAIYRYLVHHEVDGETETLFQDVQELPAAHALTFDRTDGALRIWRYWDLDPQAEIRLATEKAYAEHFLELLEDSVRIRLRSDVPVGSSLSGGIDSSTVVGLIAREYSVDRQATFSACFPGSPLDESPYIQCVMEWTGAESHRVSPDPGRLATEFQSLTWHQDLPFYGSSVYAQWNVMRLAKEENVTVLLDGQGADEILAGYHVFFGPYYRQLLGDFRWMSLMHAVYRYVRDHGGRNLPAALSLALPIAMRPRVRSLLRPRVVSREFARQCQFPPSPIRRKFKDYLREEMYRTLTHGVLPALLRYSDRNSMAFSREVRLPFLDHRLVEFVFAIPDAHRIQGSKTKVILRNATPGIIPESIRTRKDKIGYAPPQDSWLRGPLSAWLNEVLNSSRFQRRDWIDPRVVQQAWQRFLTGEQGWSTHLWHWVSLEMWARVFLDPDRKDYPAVAESGGAMAQSSRG